MKIKLQCTTNGKGYWTSKKKKVTINNLELSKSDYGDYGELRVYFTKNSWDVKKDGLIYLDEGFLKDFLNQLKKNKFSVDACNNVDYSEQGMQGDNYVSMDVGKEFIKDYNYLIGVKQ